MRPAGIHVSAKDLRNLMEQGEQDFVESLTAPMQSYDWLAVHEHRAAVDLCTRQCFHIYEPHAGIAD